MTTRIAYTGPVEGTAWIEQVLGAAFAVARTEPSTDAVAAGMREAVVFVDASMKVPITADMIEASPRLRLVITATTGADHIDAAALERRGIPLLTLKGQQEFLRNITPAAELSWLLLMACARRLRGALRHVDAGDWDRTLFPGMMLHGRTLGVIGCGRIGTWMSRYAQAFGMRTLGFDPFLASFPDTIERADLDRVMADCDFVSLHVHFSEATRSLIGARELALMKPGSCLINTSRGAIVNEDALLEGLERGQPAFYGCDVLEGEPDVRRSSVWQYAQAHDEVLITPHIGGFSPDALKRVLQFTAERIALFFAEGVR
jgi:D-3-phosphoglycerate dehydrogenase